MIVRRDAYGEPQRIICAHVDLTERKRTEKTLRELNERLENRVEERMRELHQAMEQMIASEKLASFVVLVASALHELNTPIANMLLTATALGEKLKELNGDASLNKMTRSG